MLSSRETNFIAHSLKQSIPRMKLPRISETKLAWSAPIQRLTNIRPAKIPNNKDKHETWSMPYELCLRHFCSVHLSCTLDWSTHDLTSFYNSSDCTVIIFSECSPGIFRGFHAITHSLIFPSG